MIDQDNINKEQFKRNITIESEKYASSNLTLKDFAKLVIFRCGGCKGFAREMSFSRSRASQILHGYELPKNPDTINKISLLLNVDSIVLAQLFEREREKENDRRS